jgi:AraC family transcriptional regulator of adaptative response/methylated-DNA-[protein]-cysteine methyltransferase
MLLQVARVSAPAFGTFLVAATSYGLVQVQLSEDAYAFRATLRDRFPDAQLRDGGSNARQAVKSIRSYLLGGADPRVKVVVPEEGFQARVWREIRKIPRGEVRSYARIAKALRRPGAARAVGQACGANPLPLVIPCHRVVASDGGIGGFSGSLTIKRRLLELEGFRFRE